MSLRSLFKSNKFIITAELSPPKGVDAEDIIAKVAPLRGKVHAINVTDNQRAIMRLSPLAFAHLLTEHGFEPIMQLTCRDRNALALQSDILGAAALDIENILAVSGDYPNRGDHPGTRPVYDLDSVHLIKMIRQLEEGKDLVGNELSEAPVFCVGAVANPMAEPLAPQIVKLRKKIEVGAEFIQTQPIYDIGLFKDFLEGMGGVKVKLLAGILPLKSYKMAQFMNEEVPGVIIPQEILQRMKKAKDQKAEGIQIALETIEKIRKLCSGIHLMTMNDIEVALAITDRLRSTLAPAK